MSYHFNKMLENVNSLGSVSLGKEIDESIIKIKLKELDLYKSIFDDAIKIYKENGAINCGEYINKVNNLFIVNEAKQLLKE